MDAGVSLLARLTVSLFMDVLAVFLMNMKIPTSHVLSVRPNTFEGNIEDTRAMKIQYVSLTVPKVFQAAVGVANKSIQMLTYISY